MKRSSALLLPLMVMASLPAVSALPLIQDDAGSGSDAPDAWPLATPLGPGQYRGSLRNDLDNADVYAVSPPHLSLLRLELDVPWGGSVRVIDPDRVERYCRETPGLSAFSAVADPDGSWEVRFGRTLCGGLLRFSPRAPITPIPSYPAVYELTVVYEEHEHVASLDLGDGVARTVAARFPEQRFAHLEVRYEPLNDSLGPWAVAYYARVALDAGPVWIQDAFGWARPLAGISSRPRVWADGSLPEGVQVITPSVATALELPFRLVTESVRGSTLHFGLAYSGGFHAKAWLMWDGPTADFWAPDGDRAAFRAMSDLQANDTALAVGPYARFEHASTAYDVGEGVSLLVVDAKLPLIDSQLPRGSLAPTRFEVRSPASEQFLLKNESALWAWSPAPGRWEIDVWDVDGLWGDALVFFGVTFAISPS